MMYPCTKGRIHYAQRFLKIAALAAFICLTLSACTSFSSKQKEFASPAGAVQDLVTAVKAGDDKDLLAILGPEAKELISSGDEVYDQQARQDFLKVYDEQNRIEPDGDSLQLIIGKNDWPFPIPLVKKGNLWVFDTASGKEEILNRRIGRNELDTIQVLLAIVDAQREYAMEDRDGDSLLEYAQKFISEPGKKNGLYWETAESDPPSPIGELLANARAEGYASAGSMDGPWPYHGYYFRMLTSQGQNAPDGACDYIVNGRMIGGFALVAYPALYRSSGVMTFTVNYDGVVYQKDLGENTSELAKAMTLYDPDETWAPVQ